LTKDNVRFSRPLHCRGQSGIGHTITG
jgi:hypothetical protein